MTPNFRRKEWLWLSLVTAIACEIGAAASAAAPDGDAKSASAADFEHQIVPLLVKQCLRCHNGSDPAGGLDLTDRSKAFAGGDSEQPAIVSGKVAESYLLDRVRDGEMPPPGKGQPVSAEQIELLSAWIEAGAAWPAARVLSPFEFTSESRAGRDWWSLEPPVRPEPPANTRPKWIRTPIDAFVLAGLAARGLDPSPEADRATLIRRATFDLWGLPPDPADVAAFVADRAADAYEKLIDRLLASPHYGERWGQHWLDVVRFAESNGYETNTARPTAWPYRDYVIDAFNRDTPYPQFIREQLAGDQFSGDPGDAGTATGFLVAGAHDLVGSPDPELTAQQRLNDLDDMVSTTSQAFLGLTAGCAKCHDHKFDPISQRDYYAFQAMFAGVQHGEREVSPSSDEKRRHEQEQLQRQFAELDKQMRALRARGEPLARVEGAPPAQGAALRPAVRALGNVDRFAPVKTRFLRFTVLASNGGEPCVDELEIFATDDGRNVALASAGAKATASSLFAGGTVAIHQVAHLNDGQYGNSHSWISAEPGKGWLQIELPEAVSVDRIEWARDREGIFSDRVATGYRIDVAAEPEQWQTVAGSNDRQAFEPRSPYTGPVLTAADAAELKRLETEAGALRARLTTTHPARAYAGTFATPDKIYRLHRGEPLQRREEIAPGTLTFVGTPVQLPVDAKEADRRLALAAWLGDAANPLSSRVMVNRIWHYHFGRGLVKTPSDFGFNGGRPSHAALLDWLACEFMAHEWRPKHLHRLIMLSSVYRQASHLREKAAAVDGSNELLWRFQARRLDAEPIHDAILWVSGTLDMARGGPGYEVFEPNGNYVKVYQPKQTFGPAEWRRMVYQNKPRMRPDPTFGVFDCPDGSQPLSRRNVSTTSLQSLNLLNSPFLLQQAGFFAERLTREHPGDVEAQIRRAFWLAFARAAEADEVAAARTLAESEGLPAFCRAMFNANEFVYLR